MKKRIFFWIGLLSLISTILIITNSCVKDETPLPEVTTNPIYYHTQNSANSGGTVINDGQVEIISCGVCWSTNIDPTIEDHKSYSVLSNGTFTSSITGLKSDTKYYVRAYATNNDGTSYGDNVNFKTLSPISDIDGNAYKTISINNQIWFAENLKTVHYANGDLIEDGKEVGNLIDSISPKYWFAYDNDLNNIGTFGRLYTWYAATDDRNVCPDGWHLPARSEWIQLIDNLGGEDIAGGKLKETGTMHWFDPNTGATNEARFNALPGGNRPYDGDFVTFGYGAYWWTYDSYNNSSAMGFSVHNAQPKIFNSQRYKVTGYSIRCVKD